MDEPGRSDVEEALAADVRRVADRLRSLSQARLAGPCGSFASAADAGRTVAQSLADAAGGLEGEPARPLPRLSDFAVGDQVAVTGHDLLAALGSGPVVDGETPAAVDLTALAAELTAVRRLL